MYVLDNFLRDKFLEDILIFFEKYKIQDNTFLLEGIIVNLSFKTNSIEIRKDFTKIYNNLYQRQFALLEILSIKQHLEPSRQVFNLLKDYILTHNIKIGWPEILNLFISYKNKELIQHPYPIKLFPLIDDQPQSPKNIPPLYIIYRAPELEIEEDSEEELESEEDPKNIPPLYIIYRAPELEIEEDSEEELESEEEEII